MNFDELSRVTDSQLPIVDGLFDGKGKPDPKFIEAWKATVEDNVSVVAGHRRNMGVQCCALRISLPPELAVGDVNLKFFKIEKDTANNCIYLLYKPDRAYNKYDADKESEFKK